MSGRLDMDQSDPGKEVRCIELPENSVISILEITGTGEYTKKLGEKK